MGSPAAGPRQNGEDKFEKFSNFFFWPLSRLYQLGQSVDSFRFDLNWCPPKQVNTPVVSVGNLIAGGTGKTVFVDYLIDLYKSTHSLGVACRGYKAGPDGTNDEMKLLKWHHSELKIQAHPKRHQACQTLIENGVELIILDDGFQHRHLFRNLDIVLLDASDPFSSDLLPRGLRRESIQALKRAHLLVLSHANTLSSQERECLRRSLQSRFGKPVLFGEHEVTIQPTQAELPPLKPGPIHLLAGVAQPHHVASSLEALGFSVRQTTFPPDHESPTPQQLKDLENSHWPVVCTEKDLVKLAKSMPWYVAKVKWKPLDQTQTLKRMIDQVLFS